MNEQNDRLRRIGPIEYHDHQTSVLGCLAAFLRFSGFPVRLDYLIDMAPIPETGAGDALLASIGRRLGVTVNRLALGTQAQWRGHETLMVRNTSGYWFLIWPAGDGGFLAGLPGLAGGFRRLSANSEILGTIAGVYALRKLPFAPKLQRPMRPPRMWLLPWQTRYAGNYDPKAVGALNAKFGIRDIKERPPVPLAAMTTTALRASHRSLVGAPSPIHGRYRTLNLRRGETLFVDHKALEPAVEVLLKKAREHCAAGVDEAVDFAAMLFADFLSIHPFLNGNRRMAILLVAFYLSPWKRDIDWTKVNSSQHNYWMRCTQRGHFSVLRHGFACHLIDTSRAPQSAAHGRQAVAC